MIKKLVVFTVLWALGFGFLGGGKFPFSQVQLPDLSVVFSVFSLDFATGMVWVLVGGWCLIGWSSR